MGLRIVKKYFKKGLLIVLVPAIALYLFSVIFRAVDGLWQSAIYSIFHFELWTGVGFAFTLVLIIALGWFVSLKFIENSKLLQFIKSIPKNILFSSKSNFLKDNENIKPVIVEYPCPGIYTFGFVTGEVTIEGKKFYKIFINTIPAFVTGYLFLAPEEKVKFLENSIFEMSRQLMSYGLPKIDLKILKKI